MKNNKYYLIISIVFIFSLFFLIINKESSNLDNKSNKIDVNMERFLNKDSPSLLKESEKAYPIVEIEKAEYDFGEVERKGGSVSTEFIIRNTGGANLAIGDIVTSCGCTTADISSKIIPAGENAKLKVYFDPDFHKEPLGRLTRSVFVSTDDPNKEELEFKIFVKIKN